jgi:hypothetical protein
MFTPEEVVDLRRVVRQCAQSDRKLLEKLRDEVRILKSGVKKIQPRSATAVSLVASDGGNNQLRYDPFHVQLIRVVDSYGKQLCLDAVSASSDLELLDKTQFNSDGSARTPLGRMMLDFGVTKLNHLSHMMPDAVRANADPESVPPSWVLTYRDLCEWAVLYELICYKSYSTDTLIVRDGALRSKLFRGNHFITYQNQVEAAIDRIHREDKRRVYLVGVSKHSKALERYGLAFTLENIFPDGDARYVEIPRALERKAVRWDRDVRGREEEAEGEEAAGKFVAGTMYFTRFGHHSGDPIWPVDILTKQKEDAQQIFGYLQKDAIEGFPVPYYPMCLQNAHNHAQIVDFDFDILQDEITSAIRETLDQRERPAFDELPLRYQDIANRRYS